MTDIARRAGVSRYTVSRVLKGQTQGKWAVTAERAAEIHALAQELGYLPNTAAQATASGRFGAVALLTLAEGSDFLPANVIRALVHQLGPFDLHLSVECLGPQSLEDREHLPKLLRARSVDGIFLSTGSTLPPGLRQWLEQGGLPAVWLNRKHRHDCVRPDDRGAAKRLVQLLVERGHEHIAYLPARFCAPRFVFEEDSRELLPWQERPAHLRTPHYSEQEREAGYHRACTNAGLTPRIWSPCTADPLTAVDELVQRLRTERPTAVICYRERDADLTRMAAERAGLRVPDQLFVSTFTWGSFTAPAIGMASMDVNIHTYARAAAELMQKKIAEPTTRHRSVTVPFQWTQADGMCPPRN